FFFFSSRRRHTRSKRDWSSDVCSSDLTLGLHFDLTVPLARYVLEHQNDLVFPLRRFQIQKVWRGERPQEGRFREFYQADLDVIEIGRASCRERVEREAGAGGA